MYASTSRQRQESAAGSKRIARLNFAKQSQSFDFAQDGPKPVCIFSAENAEVAE